METTPSNGRYSSTPDRLGRVELSSLLSSLSFKGRFEGVVSIEQAAKTEATANTAAQMTVRRPLPALMERLRR